MSKKTINPEIPTPHNKPMEGRKKENGWRQNRKALALLLKPTSLTPSIAGSLRLFQRDTERGTKVLLY